MANETPSRPPPIMANAILNFHFDYLHTSLTQVFRIGLEFQESECQNPILIPSPEFDKDAGRRKVREIVKRGENSEHPVDYTNVPNA